MVLADTLSTARSCRGRRAVLHPGDEEALRDQIDRLTADDDLAAAAAASRSHPRRGLLLGQHCRQHGCPVSRPHLLRSNAAARDGSGTQQVDGARPAPARQIGRRISGSGVTSSSTGISERRRFAFR